MMSCQRGEAFPATPHPTPGTAIREGASDNGKRRLTALRRRAGDAERAIRPAGPGTAPRPPLAVANDHQAMNQTFRGARVRAKIVPAGLVPAAYRQNPAKVDSRRVTVAGARPQVSRSRATHSMPARRAWNRPGWRTWHQAVNYRRSQGGGLTGLAGLTGQKLCQRQLLLNAEYRLGDGDHGGRRRCGGGYRVPPGPGRDPKAGPAKAPATMIDFTVNHPQMITEGYCGVPDRRPERRIRASDRCVGSSRALLQMIRPWGNGLSTERDGLAR